MNKISFVLESRNCTVYETEQPEFLLLRPVGSHEVEMQDQLAEALCTEIREPFLLAGFEIENWNRDLSPWKEPPVFGPEGFGDGAGETLRFIRESLIPCLRERYCLPQGIPVILGGYSLAGLSRCGALTRPIFLPRLRPHPPRYGSSDGSNTQKRTDSSENMPISAWETGKAGRGIR